MSNPILNNKRYRRIYLFSWLVVFIIHALLMIFVLNEGLVPAIIDSAIYNFFYAIMGVSIWYIVYFNDYSSELYMKYFRLVFAAVVFTGIWYGLSTPVYRVLITRLAYEPIEIHAWRLILGVLIFLTLSLTQYLIIYYENLKEKINVEARLRETLKESELNALKSKLNPHFLFNSLNSVNALIMNDPSKAQEMLLSLSTYLRYSISNKNENFSSLSEEFENSKRYLSIEQIRFRDKLEFVWEIDKECCEVKVPPMILQPLYENSIKHGVYESNDLVLVKTTCSCKDSFVEIYIYNDVNPSSTPRKGEGLGLKNVKDRLFLNYGSGELIKTNKSDNKFEVTVRIPVSMNLS